MESGYTGATRCASRPAQACPAGGCCTTSRPATCCSWRPPAISPTTAAGRRRADGRPRCGLTGGELLDRAVELMWETFSEPHFWAAVKLWTAARTNPELRKALLGGKRGWGGGQAGRGAFSRRRSTPTPLARVRDLLLTSMRGVGLAYAFDPRDPATIHTCRCGRAWRARCWSSVGHRDERHRPGRDPLRRRVCGLRRGRRVVGAPAPVCACGHVGCCDSSPAQHATAHFRGTGHPVVQSFEPGEDWFWDYRAETAVSGPELAEPRTARSTRPCPDRPSGCRATGSSTSTEARLRSGAGAAGESGMTLAEDVDAAAARLRGVAVTTPLQRNERLSAATGAKSGSSARTCRSAAPTSCAARTT